MCIYLTYTAREQGDQLNELVDAYHTMEDSLRNQIRQQAETHRITVGDLKARLGETKAMLESTRLTVSRHHDDLAALQSDLLSRSETIVAGLRQLEQDISDQWGAHQNLEQQVVPLTTERVDRATAYDAFTADILARVEAIQADYQAMLDENEGIITFLADVPQNFAFNKTSQTYQMVLPDRLKFKLRSAS